MPSSLNFWSELSNMPGEKIHPFQSFLTLTRLSSEVLLETTVEKMLRKVIDAARELTGANLGTFVGRDKSGSNIPETASIATKDETFSDENRTWRIAAEMCHEITGGRSFRLNFEELCTHPALAELAGSLPSLRGLLGAPVLNGDGREIGIILVADKAQGEFTAEDEIMLSELAGLSALGLRHIELRSEAERRAAQMDSLFASLMEGVLVMNAAGVITQANPALVWILGFNPVALTPGELLNEIDLKRSDGRNVEVADFSPILAATGRTSVNEQFVLTNKKGRVFHITLSSAPLFQKARIS
ncbi:MAG: GAF domain-containing protein, partial [Syntrophobacteraceae bacterium]